MISFSYDDKQNMVVDLTCECYLSNDMRDSIFYDGMVERITVILFFTGDNYCFSLSRRDGCNIATIKPWEMGNTSITYWFRWNGSDFDDTPILE